MPALILRNHAIRVLPWWLAIGAGITAHLYVIYLLDALRTAFSAWVPWFPLALYLLVIGTERRARELDLTLPIPARRLWLAHVLALALGGGAVLTVSAALMAMRGPAVGVPGEAIEVIVTALRLAAGLAIVLALTQSFQPALVRRARSLKRDVLLVALLAVVPVIVLVLDGGWLAVLLGAALALTYRTWRSLPPAFTLVLSEPEPSAGTAVPKGRPADTHSPVVHPWRPARHRGHVTNLARLLLHIHAHSGRRPQQICFWSFCYPLCVVLGLGLSGGAPPVSDIAGTMLLILLPAGAMASLMGPVALTMRLLTMLDPLPASRRFLFAATVFPAFAALALGFVIGAARGDRGGASAAVAALVLALVGVLWLGAVAFATRSRHREWGCSMYAVFLVMLAVFLPLRLAAVKGWFGAPFAFAEAVAGQVAAALPGGEATVTVASVVLLAAAYVLSEARFRRFEVGPGRGGNDSWFFADLRPFMRESSGGAS